MTVSTGAVVIDLATYRARRRRGGHLRRRPARPGHDPTPRATSPDGDAAAARHLYALPDPWVAPPGRPVDGLAGGPLAPVPDPTADARAELRSAFDRFGAGYRTGFDGTIGSALAAAEELADTVARVAGSLPARRRHQLAVTGAQQVISAIGRGMNTGPVIDGLVTAVLREQQAAWDRGVRPGRFGRRDRPD
ncbi:hypothetical protein [Microlunatus ginsengisoli]|uniref:Uncharacterized protein n=1 Tax=Microlunatus ginsengisoli TaxID=363863 RepID=A0ABP7ALL0_9ACTN